MSTPHGDRLLLTALAQFEYRALILQDTDLPKAWRQLDWLEHGACRDAGTVIPGLCERCPVVSQCLACALVADDQAAWRGGMARLDRVQLFAELEAAAWALDPWLMEASGG